MASGELISTGPGLKELFSLFNLLVVFGIVYVFGRKAIQLAISTRSETIKKDLVSARQELEKIQLELGKTKKDLESFTSQKTQILSEAKLQAEEIRKTILNEARLSADQIIDNAKKSVDNQVTKAAISLRGKVIDEAVAIAKGELLTGHKDSVHSNFISEIKNRGVSNGGT